MRKETIVLTKVAENLDPEALRSHGRRMKELSDAVHEVMGAQGIATGNCHTVCHQEIEVGPDGVPRTKLVCETVCV
jgi:hypothetical protein